MIPGQPIDEAYTRKIREYTTEPFFLSPLVDYLPASKTVPTPKVVLGDIAGAPNKLPYSKEVYEYMRLLAKASPRVKVFSIGTTEEGREMIAVAIASEALMSRLDENKARLAKLADPRTIGMNDAEAARLAGLSTPVYYITGTIHSPERGAHRADGAGLPPGGGREPLHQEHPRQPHHPDHADRRGGWTGPAGGSVQVAHGPPERHLAQSAVLGALRGPRQQPRRDGH